MIEDGSAAQPQPPLDDATAAGLLDLGGAASFPAAPDEAGDSAGAVIGRYQLVAPLGEGGFGVVWHARQSEPIRRDLALKLIKLGMDTREVIARFQSESRVLALMDHPNIAAVLDAGMTPDGRPYFVMERVAGDPLTRHCDLRKLPLRERLELFIPVCLAVQHAHQKAVLHRDLKPSNILVAESDGRPVPKVIDFGIAKALGGGNEPESLLRTRAGLVVGTPEYMSPEQAGSMPDVDTRSDVHSLGAILYELLTGRTPFGSAAPGEGRDEILRRVRCEDAVKPSQHFQAASEKARAAASARGSDPQKLRRQLRRDLDWITLKALEKDRRRRYQTAAGLAEDLQRFLRQEPVDAAAPGWAYRFSRFARRNRVGLMSAGLVAAALLAGTAASLWQAREARSSSREAERSRADAQANYQDARDAVELYLSRVTEDPRLKESNFQALRKDLLETALPFYEKQGRRAGSDIVLLSDRARATGSLAHIHQQLGNLDRSEALFREAIRLNQRVLERRPDLRVAREDLTLHGNNLAFTLQNAGRPAEGYEALRQAESISAGLVADFPDDTALRYALMSILLNQVIQLGTLERPDEAERVCRRVVELGRGLVAANPGAADYRGQLSSGLSTLAGIHHAAGRLDESEQTFREALRMQEQLLEESPGDLHLSAAIANSYHNLGHLLAARGRPADAAELLRRSVAVNRARAAEYPEMPQPRKALAIALSRLAAVLASLGDPSACGPVIEESASLLERLHAGQPANAEFLHLQGHVLDQLSVVRRGLGDHQAALAALLRAVEAQRRALALLPDQPNQLVALRSHFRGLAATHVALRNPLPAMDAAEAWLDAGPSERAEWEELAGQAAAIATFATTMPDLPAGDRTHLFRRSLAVAVESLRGAADLGFPNLLEMKRDRRFSAMAADPTFVALAEPPVDPQDRSPHRFTFDYPYEDPGLRVWTRTGAIWTERQPSGKTNLYQISGRLRLGGVCGTEAVHTERPGITVFIPDLGAAAPALAFRSDPDPWVQLGPVRDNE